MARAKKIDNAISEAIKSLDQPEKHPKDTKLNKGLTYKSKIEYSTNKNNCNREFYGIHQKNSFKPEIVENIEKIQGEIIDSDDLNQFKELYTLTCQTVLDNFMTDNADLTKKYAHSWFRRLLLEIKKNTPKLTANDIDKLPIVWDCISYIMDTIGLFMTYECFYKVTGIDKKLIENRKGVNQKYIDFLAKIYTDCRSALENELYYSPFNTVSKMFMAKSVYGIIEKTEPKQIEIHHDITNYNALPMFKDEKK